MSDYGFAQVDTPVYINQVLREAGLMSIEAAANGDQIACGTSRTFPVCDNLVAHVYVANSDDIDSVRTLLLQTPGIVKVLDADAQREVGIEHSCSGELAAVADAKFVCVPLLVSIGTRAKVGQLHRHF